MVTAEKEEKETGTAQLLMHDNATSALCCMQVDCKEAKPDIVAWMNQNLVDAGYAGMRLTLKSNGEPAMNALKEALALKRGCDTSIRHSPARESKSNGAVERATQTWKGQMGTMSLHWEDRLKTRTKANHPLRSWLAACFRMRSISQRRRLTSRIS